MSRILTIASILMLLAAAPAFSETGGETVPHQETTLLDRPDVLRVLFHPRPDLSPKPGDGLLVRVPVAEDIRLSGRLYKAEKGSPVILLFPGNGENASAYRGISVLYTGMGISLLVADYRGYGRSDGTPTASALLADAMAVYHAVHDILSEHGLDDSRLFIMGRSLGSAAAIEVASHAGNRIKGLIIDSGFAHTFSLIERLGGPSLANVSEKDSGFNNAGKMERVDGPTLIIHGEADVIIPHTDGKALFSHCGAHNKRFVSIPDGGHNDLLLTGGKLYFDAVREFVSE